MLLSFEKKNQSNIGKTRFIVLDPIEVLLLNALSKPFEPKNKVFKTLSSCQSFERFDIDPCSTLLQIANH